MLIIVEPDSLRSEGKPCDGKLGYMQFSSVIFEAHVRQLFQASLSGREQLHRSSLRLQERACQQCRLDCGSVVADVETCGGSLSVFGSTLPMGHTMLNREVFVHGSLQIVVARNVRARRRSIRGNYVVRYDLGTATTIVELEGAVDLTARRVDVHFTSCCPTVTQDCVAKRLGRDSVSSPQRRDGKKKGGEQGETKHKHGSVLCH